VGSEDETALYLHPGLGIISQHPVANDVGDSVGDSVGDLKQGLGQLDGKHQRLVLISEYSDDSKTMYRRWMSLQGGASWARRDGDQSAQEE